MLLYRIHQTLSSFSQVFIIESFQHYYEVGTTIIAILNCARSLPVSKKKSCHSILQLTPEFKQLTNTVSDERILGTGKDRFVQGRPHTPRDILTPAVDGRPVLMTTWTSEGLKESSLGRATQVPLGWTMRQQWY